MSDDRELAEAIIRLMRGVVYREADEPTWATLTRSGAGVRDHFATIGVDVVLDDDEGYAFLRTRPAPDGEDPLPRLVRRHQLTYPVSLLLVLLRKRQVEFETTGGDSGGKLVVSTEQVVEMLRLFSADTSNEARLTDHAEGALKKAADLGFVRRLPKEADRWEVRRILKAYVDAETLGDLARTLTTYAGTAARDQEDAS